MSVWFFLTLINMDLIMFSMDCTHKTLNKFVFFPYDGIFLFFKLRSHNEFSNFNFILKNFCRQIVNSKKNFKITISFLSRIISRLQMYAPRASIIWTPAYLFKYGNKYGNFFLDGSEPTCGFSRNAKLHPYGLSN